MYRLDDIFNVARSYLQGQSPPRLPESECHAFDTAWLIFLMRVPQAPDDYTKIWKASASMVITKQPELLTVKSLQTASYHMAMSYITSGLSCAEEQLKPSGATLEQRYSHAIGPKLILMTKIALQVKEALLVYKPKGSAPQDMPEDMRKALGEFYSLALFTFKELRANLGKGFHSDLDAATTDFEECIYRYGLPRLITAHEREAEAIKNQGAIPLPPRRGINIAKGDGAEIVDFSALQRRQNGRHEL